MKRQQSVAAGLLIGPSMTPKVSYDLYHIHFMSFSSYNGYKLNSHLICCRRGFIAQLVEYRGGRGFSEFFLDFICNCLSYFTTAMISFTSKGFLPHTNPHNFMFPPASEFELWEVHRCVTSLLHLWAGLIKASWFLAPFAPTRKKNKKKRWVPSLSRLCCRILIKYLQR